MKIRYLACLLAAGTTLSASAIAQEPVRYRSAVVALAGDADLRATFERGLVAKAIEHDYDAVTSYDIEANVDDLDDESFVQALGTRGIRAVLMLRPAALGPGSSLESVHYQVPPGVFESMEQFARLVTQSDPNDLIAVVHMAIYVIADNGEVELVSAGAVWLDEEVDSQAEGIDRLQDLIVYNVNAVRPSIRRHLGLPPLSAPDPRP